MTIKNRLVYKKASIGSTITAIAATFIIFFIMAGFIILTIGINKLSGSEKLEADSAKTYGQTSSDIDSLLAYLNFAQADGKSPLEKIKQGDFGFLNKDFRDNPKQTKKLLNVDCYILGIMQDGSSKFSTGQRGANSRSYDIVISQWNYIYLTSNSGEVILIKYYGGSCAA